MILLAACIHFMYLWDLIYVGDQWKIKYLWLFNSVWIPLRHSVQLVSEWTSG